MYKAKISGDTAEFWFDDVDEWEIAYEVDDKLESEGICSMSLCLNYSHDEVIPDDGRYLLLILDVTNMARVEQIMQEAWQRYEADVAEARS